MARGRGPTCPSSAIAANVGHAARRCAAPAEVCAVVKADGYGHGAVPWRRAALEAGAAVAGRRPGAPRRASCAAAGIDAPILLLSEPRPPRSTRRSPPALRRHRLHARARRAPRRGGRHRRAAGARPPQGRHRHAPGRRGAGRRRRARPARSPAAPGPVASTRCGPTAPSPTSPTTPSPPCSSSASTPRVAARSTARGHRRAAAPRRQLGRRHRPPAPAATTSCAAASRSTASRPAPALAGAVALEPALRLATEVAFVKPVAAGEGISYGLRHHFERGHASWPRCRSATPTACSGALGAVGQDVLIGGHRRPMVGVVTMDQLMVDVGPDSERAGRATRSCCSARRATSGSPPTSGRPPRHDRLRGRLRARSPGSSAATTARRLHRRDRGRHHHLRRPDARPGRRAGRPWPGPATSSCWPATSAPARPRSRRASAAASACPSGSPAPPSPSSTLRGPAAGPPPRRLPARAAERGARPRAAGDARRGWGGAHRVGRRDPRRCCRTTTSRCGSPSAPATTTATSRSGPSGRRGRSRSDAVAGVARPLEATPDADPRHQHRHRPGRLRHRRPRGRPRRDPLDPRAAPRRDASRPPSSSCAARPRRAERDRRDRRRPRPGAVHRAAGRRGRRQGHGARAAAADDRRAEPRPARLPAAALAPPHRVRHRRRPRRDLLRLLPPGRRAACSGSPTPGSARPTTSPPSSRPRARRCCSSATAPSATTRPSTAIRRVELADHGVAYPLAGSLVQLAHARALREEFVSPCELDAALPAQARRRDQLEPRATGSVG